MKRALLSPVCGPLRHALRRSHPGRLAPKDGPGTTKARKKKKPELIAMQYTPEQVQKWTEMTIGKRLIISGESAALRDARATVAFWAGQADGTRTFAYKLTPEQIREEIKGAAKELEKAKEHFVRQENAPATSLDIEARDLPFASKCRLAYTETYCDAPGVLEFTVDSNGIITSLAGRGLREDSHPNATFNC